MNLEEFILHVLHVTNIQLRALFLVVFHPTPYLGGNMYEEVNTSPMNNRCLCVRRRCRDGQEDDAASAASRLQSGVPAFRQQQWQLADSVVPLLALWISF